MNYIGIDTSLSSTGMVILDNNKKHYYFNYKSNDKLTKLHKVLSYINYNDYKNTKMDNYSDNEVAKIIQYNKITDKIVSDILSICKPEESIIVTEGFSFSSNGDIIDLVTYATILRNKLINLPFNNFIIKSPSTLKLDTCKITYKPLEKQIGGKNPRTEYIYKSDIGMAGGNFKKHDMLKSVMDNVNITCEIKESLSYHISELYKMKAIPKPIDDIIDALLLIYTEILEKY